MQRFLSDIRKGFRSQKGFTLIELIVVIAVMGILVIMAAPKFMGYTRDAKVASLQTDVKTLSDAAMLYNIESRNDSWPGEDQTDNETKGQIIVGVDDKSKGSENLPTGLYNAMTALGYNDTHLANKVIRFNPRAIEEGGELYKYVKNLNNPVDEYVIVVEGKLEGEVFHMGKNTGTETAPEFAEAGQISGDRLTTWYGVQASITQNETKDSPNDSAKGNTITHINGIEIKDFNDADGDADPILKGRYEKME